MKTAVSINRGVQQARLGHGLHKWVDDKKPGASSTVLTDTALVYNLSAGYAVFIVSCWAQLTTASDNLHVNLVSCTAVNGGGVATDISGHLHVVSSGNMAGTENDEREFIVPIRCRYKDGVRSISMRVDANDAAAVMHCGWDAWVEAEEG